MAAVQKRKRDAADIADPRPAPAMNVDHEFDQAYLHADDEAMETGDVDFDAAFGNPEAETAVEEQEAEEEAPPEAKAAEPASASDTAAAAMAQYHTMTVPQSTEQSFLAGQKADGNGQPQETPGAEAASASAPRTGMQDILRYRSYGFLHGF